MTEPRTGLTAAEPLTAEELQARLERVRKEPGFRAYEYDALVRDAPPTATAGYEALRTAGEGLLEALGVYERVWLTSGAGYSVVRERKGKLRVALAAADKDTPPEGLDAERLARELHKHWLDSTESDEGRVYAVCTCGVWVPIDGQPEVGDPVYEFTLHTITAALIATPASPTSEGER